MKKYLNILLMALVFRSFYFLTDAVDFYESLPENKKEMARIVHVGKKGWINGCPYRVYYEAEQ